MRWLRHWGPAIGWAGAVWIFSTYLFSADSTARFLLPALKWLLPHASQKTLLLLHHLIRKSAHAAEYFILSLLLLRGIRSDRPGWRLPWGLAALGMAACYASLDEVHQLFVPGRVASVFDVLRDSAGAAAAQLWVWLRHRGHGANLDRRTTAHLPPAPSSQSADPQQK